MTTEAVTKKRVGEETILLSIPTEVFSTFEKADAQLREFYGVSPGAEALFQLWAAGATSHSIRTEFQETVLDINQALLKPNEKGLFDETSL